MSKVGLFSIAPAASALTPFAAAALEWHTHFEGHSNGAWAGGILAILGILIVLGIFFLSSLVIRALVFGIRLLSRRVQGSAPPPAALRQKETALAAAAGGSEHRVDADAGAQLFNAGLPATNKDQSSVDPDKILNLEQSVYKVARPLSWIGVGTDIFLSLIVVSFFAGMLLFVLKDAIPAKFAMPVLALVILLVMGGIIRSIYQAWAFSQDPTAKTNVVLKPAEIVSYITSGAALLIVFGGFLFALVHSAVETPGFFLSRDFFVFAFALLILAGIGVLAGLNYKCTVTDPITNPHEVANVSVDAGEKIQFSIAGITRVGTFRDRGFNQKFLFFTPQSGRRMNPNAQNALIASSTRVYFIFVPVSLSDQTTTNAEALEWSFGQKYIQAKLDEMIKSMSLSDIYESNPINFAINFYEIGHMLVKETGFINRQSIKFFDRGNQTLQIVVRNKSDLDKAVEFFSQAGLAVEVE